MKIRVRIIAFILPWLLYSFAYASDGEEQASGLDVYRSLKANLYDFSVLEKAEHFLNKQWKPNRPSHCPLNQTNGLDLLEKLQKIHSVLENTSCKEYKDGHLSSFGTAVTKMSSSYLSLPAASDPLLPINDTNNQLAYYRSMNDMIGSLSSMVSDARCALDIKNRGMIPVLSDVLGSASVGALMQSSKYSFIAGVSGLAVTATMKIISGLLRPTFDMTRSEDRENFIKLACSFYDLRLELEKNNFLRIPTQQDARNHEMALAYTESIQSKIYVLSEAKDAALVSLAEEKNQHIEKILGKEKVSAMHALSQLKDVLIAKSIEQNPSRDRSLAFRTKLVRALSDATATLRHQQFDNQAYETFTNVEKDVFAITNFRAILLDRDLSDNEITTYFLHHVERLKDILDYEVDQALASLTLEKHHGETFGQMEKNVVLKFDEQLAKLTAMHKRIDDYESVLAKIMAKKNFREEDEGTHLDHLIIQEFKNIQAIFFGHDGWRFYEYVRDNAKSELSHFYEKYQEFREKYFSSNPTRIRKLSSENQRRVACATASNIVLSVSNARSLVNMGTDFIFTNRDFFHENVDAIDIHLKIIPTGRSKEIHLLEQARSLVNAKSILGKKNKLHFPRSLTEHFSSPNIGILMLAQEYAEAKIAELYKFISINNCTY